jgi:hypothetical protein
MSALVALAELAETAPKNSSTERSLGITEG